MSGRGDHGFDDGIATATRAAAGEPKRTAAARFLLQVVAGPETGKHFTVDGSTPSRSLIGQSASCDFRLADREVSRRHLAVDVRGSELRVTDLGSTNGTRVNGLRVHDASLAGGEVVVIGATTFRVHMLERDVPTKLSTATSFGKLRGESDEMRRLYPLCERLAAADVPVVIEGETGTGKEVLAESIHEQSRRARGPFVVFDCTAVTPTLLEAALFGHERGAFTGANETRIGVFEEAHGGTLLIDEIGDLDVTLQAKLLRALERQEVRRVGGKQWLEVDVRVLAATRRDLDRAVQEGRFRDDLYFRLAVTRIELPPLRRRHGDVELLAHHFWSSLSTDGSALPPELLERLTAHDWPGNVRELYHAIARYVALGDLAPASLAPRAPGSASQLDVFEQILALDLPLGRAREQLVDAFERRYVERVVARHGGNVARAAEASGLARRYFQILRARHRGESER